MKAWLFSTTVALVAGPSLGAATLDQQLQQVQEAIATWRLQKQIGPVTMVLGAQSHDHARFAKAGPHTLWVYVDVCAHQNLDQPHLQMDFNKFEDLGKVAGALKGQVDTVCFDAGVVYFTEWTADHLAAVSALLTAKGSFFMPAGTDQNSMKILPPFQPGKDGAADGARLGALIAGGNGLMPTNKRLPTNWDALPAALRKQALRVRQQRIQTMLEKAFATVEVRTFLPRHVKAHGHQKEAFDQYACNNRKA